MTSPSDSLAQLPSLYAQLALLLATRTPGTTTDEPQAHTPASSRPPLRVEVLDALTGTLEDLAGWSGSLAQELGCSPPDGSHLPAVCRFLAWALPDSSQSGGVNASVMYWYWELRKLVGEKEESGNHVEGCGLPLHHESGMRYRCSGCGDVVDLGANLQRVADEQQAVSLQTASVLTGKPLSTLKLWATNGTIKPVAGRKPRVYPLPQIRKRCLPAR